MAKANLHRWSVQEGINILTGGGGYDIVTNATINNTTNPNTTWVAIQILVGTEVIADNTASGTITATCVDGDHGDNLSNLEVPVGATIYGNWSAITIGANDTAICYRSNSTAS